MQPSPIIVIVGPTSSGKSVLAVRLARKFSGEIISADSRQVYRGLDIGSGKITKREMKGIPHHLLDVANPKRTFTVSQYQKLARRALENITHRGHLPIICGGAGFYIDALRGRATIPPVPPNQKLRAQLEKLDTEKLFQKLKKLDPARAKNIDRYNRHRLIRAIEIAMTLNTKGRLWESNIKGSPLGNPKDCPWDDDWLMLGIKLDPNKLKNKINARLKFRINHGLIAEVKKLHQNGLSWKRLEAFGLEYRFGAKLLQRQVKREEIVGLERNIWHYAKRQMTWWKRDQTIHWVKNYREAAKLTCHFLRACPPKS